MTQSYISSNVEESRSFYDNNRELVIIAGLIGLSVLLNRRTLRKELKRMNFVVEYIPFEIPTPTQ